MALESVSGMVQTPEGDLWLNGLHGVSRIAGGDLHAAIKDGRPMRVKLFQQTDLTGPSPQTYGFPSAFMDSGKKLRFNTSGAIVSLDPAHLPRDPLAPVLTLAQPEQDGQPVGPDHTNTQGQAQSAFLTSVRTFTRRIRLPIGISLEASTKPGKRWRIARRRYIRTSARDIMCFRWRQ